MKLLPLLLCAAAASARPVAFVNARIYTVTQGVIPLGTLVIDNGKIVSASPGDAPPGAQRIDCRGKVLMPGLVDTHSHIGLAQVASNDVNEGSGPTQSGLRALDAILPTAETVRTALAGEGLPHDDKSGRL